MTQGFWAWLVLWFASQSLFGVCSPLADVIALRRARTEGFNYGWPRGIGSAAYVLGNVAMGCRAGAVAAPDALLVWIAVAAGAVGVRPGSPGRWPASPIRCTRAASASGPARDAAQAACVLLLGDPVFQMLAIVSTGLIQLPRTAFTTVSRRWPGRAKGSRPGWSASFGASASAPRSASCGSWSRGGGASALSGWWCWAASAP